MNSLSALSFILIAIGLAIGNVAEAQAPSERVQIDARVGAKVNVRAEPVVASGNIVGKAIGGDIAEVLETSEKPPYVWYRVRDLDGTFEGWIRGDLIVAASAASVAPTPSVEVQTGVEVARPTTLAEPSRADRTVPRWVTQLPEFLLAARACVATGSAQPSLASDLRVLQRGLVEIDIVDAAGRQWKCIVRETGGTPLRFDPMFSSRTLNERAGPYFAMVGRVPPGIKVCDPTDPIAFPGSTDIAGEVIYTDCP